MGVLLLRSWSACVGVFVRVAGVVACFVDGCWPWPLGLRCWRFLWLVLLCHAVVFGRLLWLGRRWLDGGSMVPTLSGRSLDRGLVLGLRVSSRGYWDGWLLSLGGRPWRMCLLL